MRIEPLNFKEFDSAIVVGGNANLPIGTKRKETMPPPPPTFSEEQLKAAEREAYKKGFIDGTQEGRLQAETEQAAIARTLAENTEKFAHSILPLVADYRQMILQLRRDMPKTALAVARKAAGKALTENAYPVVEEMALRCVEMMIAEPKVNITVHDSLADILEKNLTSITERAQTAAHITVARDATMATSDCRIEWKYGAMERHTGQLWQRLEEAVEQMAAGAEYTTEKQIESLQASFSTPGEQPATKE